MSSGTITPTDSFVTTPYISRVSAHTLGSNFSGLQEHAQLQLAIASSFQEPFAWIEVESGDVIHCDRDALSCDFYSRIEVIAEVARRGKPTIIEDVSPICVIAIPCPTTETHPSIVAIGIFVTDQVSHTENLDEAAQCLGLDNFRMLDWIQGREVWTPRQALRTAELVVENTFQKKKLAHLNSEISDAINHVKDTYRELSLLHRVAQHLHLSKDETDLWKKSLGWLSEKLPVQCVALVPNIQKLIGEESTLARNLEVLTSHECPIDVNDLQDLISNFGPGINDNPLLLGKAETSLATWPYPSIKELIVVPVFNGDNLLAWLIAINHNLNEKDGSENFSSVETRLLSSVATMLGIHSGNIQLYREQSELIASSVQALISAIDAKDQYTAGHSDRVARVSVKLAKELGLHEKDQETIYLAGLLHDIGKIGIDDQILNKPGKLTKEEFEQVKRHPEFGYEILKGVRQLQHILPMVLHHHEAWDGRGYPHGLRESEIPIMARIISVADAFDAMSSDRSYRRGISDEKLDSILSDGAGSQWDPKVVDAFFAIRDEIRDISLNLPLESSHN